MISEYLVRFRAELVTERDTDEDATRLELLNIYISNVRSHEYTSPVWAPNHCHEMRRMYRIP